MQNFDEQGYFFGTLPSECVKSCSHQGDCFEDVEFWQRKLSFEVPREQAISYLKAFGAWPLKSNKYDKGLNDMSDTELAQKVLWMACNDIKEQGEWFGLVH